MFERFTNQEAYLPMKQRASRSKKPALKLAQSTGPDGELESRPLSPEESIQVALPLNLQEEIYKARVLGGYSAFKQAIANSVGFLRVIPGNSAEFWTFDFVNHKTISNFPTLRDAALKFFQDDLPENDCRIFQWPLTDSKESKKARVLNTGLNAIISYDGTDMKVLFRITGAG